MSNDFLASFLQSRREATQQSQFDRELQARLDLASQEFNFRKQQFGAEQERASRLDALSRDQFEANKQYNQANTAIAQANSRREGISMINSGQADAGMFTSVAPQAPGLPTSPTSLQAPNAMDLGGGIMGVPNSPEEIASRQADIQLRNKNSLVEAEYRQKVEESKRYFPDNPKLQLQYQMLGPDKMNPSNLQEALVRELNTGGDTTKILGLLKSLAAAERSPGQEAAAFASANANNAQAGMYAERANDMKLTQSAQGVLREATAQILPTLKMDKNDPKFHGTLIGLLDAKVKDGTIKPEVANKAVDLLNVERQNSSQFSLTEYMIKNPGQFAK
jgi:hypothetical protein